MKTHNYVDSLPNFPRVPEVKRLRAGEKSTQEKVIVTKTIDSEPISRKEEKLFKAAIEFYKKLIPRLHAVDLSKFSPKELSKIKSYFHYAFNHVFGASTLAKINLVVRVVVNEKIFGKELRITEPKYLSYPPVDVVKANGQYNRASTSSTTVFYGGFTIDAVLKEIQPKCGKLVTVGVWYNKNPEKRIKSYPVIFGEKARKVSEETQKAYQQFLDVKAQSHPLLAELMQVLFDFLGKEFSKEIVNNVDYLFSALYSEKILFSQRDANSPVAIFYPSIKNEFKYQNIAIHPGFFSDNFDLQRVFEFRIGETNYNEKEDFNDTFAITTVVPWNLAEPREIIPDKIVW